MLQHPAVVSLAALAELGYLCALAGDAYIMKQVPSNIRDPVSEQFNRPEFYRNQFHRYKGVAGEQPVVGKVLLSANDDSFLVVKTLVRHVRYAGRECLFPV